MAPSIIGYSVIANLLDGRRVHRFFAGHKKPQAFDLYQHFVGLGMLVDVTLLERGEGGKEKQLKHFAYSD